MRAVVLWAGVRRARLLLLLTGCLILGVLGLGTVEAHAATPASLGPPGFSESFASTGLDQLTSKEQCKHGGWLSFGFKNQGDCVSFVATGGKNPPLTAGGRAPVLAGIEPGALAYTENDPATPITSALTVTAAGNITGATVTIGTGFASPEDVLSFANQLGITGSYNAASGVLTLSGSASAADYQTALRAVMYSNTSENPSTLTRTVTFQVRAGPRFASNTASRDVTVTAVQPGR